MSKKRILFIILAFCIILYLAKDVYPVTVIRDALTPMFTQTATLITNLYNTVGQNLLSLPIIGTLLGTGITVVLAAFRSRMNTMKTGAVEEIKNLQGHVDTYYQAKVKAEQELATVQNQLTDLKQEKTNVTEELLILKTDLLDVRNEFDKQTIYVRQLETEKLSAERNLASVTDQLKQFLEEQKKVA